MALASSFHFFSDFEFCYILKHLTLLPMGGAFWSHHQTGSQNSRTLSPRVSKISDFFFMPLGHIVAKFQVD